MELIDRRAFIEQEMKRDCSDCIHRKGYRKGKFKILYAIGGAACKACLIMDVLDDLEDFPTENQNN